MPKSVKTALTGWVSLLIGLLATLFFVGYGITAEVPVGSVDGKVVMQENSRPLAGAFVTMTHLTTSGLWEQEDVPTEHHFRADPNGSFHLWSVLAGEYVVTVSAKAHRLSKFILDVKEGKPTSITLEAPPIPHYLELYASQRVFLPTEHGVIRYKGYTGLPPSGPPILTARIYKLDFNQVIKEGGMYNALAPLARRDNGKVVDPATMGKQVQSMTVPQTVDAEGLFTHRLQLPVLPNGLYWVACHSGDQSSGTWISVSSIALVLKHTDADVAGYVTKMDTGQPVVGASVGFVSEGNVVSSATTDVHGLVRMALKPKKQSVAEVLVASYGDARALVDFQRTESDSTSNDNGDSNASEIHMYTYTDRPIYRPGDLVQFKGIVRRLVGSKYELPSGHSVVVQVQDSSGTVLNSQTLPLNEMGSYHGSYQFSPDALPDDYTLVTNYGSASSSKDFGVAAYRKPTFSISVNSDKPTYVRGETANVTVAAKYYYGAPVVGAKVTATVSRTPIWDWSEFDDSEADFENDYEDEMPDQMYPGQQLVSYGGDQVQTLSGVTDESGKVVLQVSTMGANESQEELNDYSYDVSVDVADASNKEYPGDGVFNVRRSDETLRLDTAYRVLTAGQPFEVNATLLDAQGKPKPGVTLQAVGGFLRWTRRKEITVDKSNFSAVTGPDGTAMFRLQPPGEGYYQLKVQFTDDRNHVVSETTEAFLFISPSLQMQGEGEVPETGLQVTLDKKRYKAGDTARVLITCSRPGGVAMLGIEGDLIYDVKTIPLNSRATVFSFPVTNDFSPDAFVAVAYVKDKHFSQASQRLLVDLGVKKLQVKVTSDKPVYHPGDTAVYSVSTKDSLGKPVPAEVSLGVVDESIYAIFDDQSDIVKGFYPKRYDAVQTDYSFPELYLGGGDKAPTNIQIRRNFKDTAFWSPVVETDKSGSARVRVKLPDNLTSWRTTVRAVTSDTHVGQAICNVVTRKDLMVELSAPAFVVMGDQERLLAMITNNTGRDADVHISLDAQDAAVQGDLNATVHVANGAMQTASFNFSPDHAGQADFIAKAWVSGGASDGMELKVPVNPHARLDTDGFAGSTSSAITLNMELKKGFDPYSGGLRIMIAPTVATALLGSLNELVNYPYGCVEQTTSRFLPTVVFGKAYSDLGLPKPKLFDQIPQIVQDSYSRLQAMQHGDGGWGWWEYDDSDPYMTAYVLEALHRAEGAGYPPPKSIDTGKALDWSCDFIKGPHFPQWVTVTDAGLRSQLKSDTAYLIYAVSLYGRTKQAKDALAHVDIGNADAAQCAFYALAAHQLGDVGLRDQSLKRMLSLGSETRSTLEWPEQDWYGYETTGRCFMALETIDPESPEISKIVALLMQKRDGDFWYSTRDTSAILLAMADYLRHTKELTSNAEFMVTLNGKQLQEYQYPQGHFPADPAVIDLPVSDLQQGDNRLELKVNSGTCYYAATLKQYVSASTLLPQPFENSLSVSRAYYKLEAQRMEDGTLRLMPSHDPVSSYAPGEVMRCSIKIHSDVRRDYVFIEVPTPSGLHVTDRETPDEGDQWTYWWSRTVILDNRVCLFARNLPKGDSEMDFVLQAENPGTCDALPVSIYNMYDSHVNASSGEDMLEVSK